MTRADNISQDDHMGGLRDLFTGEQPNVRFGSNEQVDAEATSADDNGAPVDIAEGSHLSAADAWGTWFPLLAGKEFGEMRLQPLATASVEERARLTQLLVNAMVERWAAFEWTRLVPAVAADVAVLESSLSTRAKNVLMRRGLSSLQMVLQLSTNHLYKIPNAGAGTVREIAEWVLTESIQAALSGTDSGVLTRPQGEDLAVRDLERATSDLEQRQVLVDLETIAGWMTIRGLGSSAPLLSQEAFAPDGVKAARQRILNMPAVEVLPESQDPVALLAEALEGLRPESLQVARLRTFANDPVTLQHLADQIGRTRERVRQLEQGIFSKLSKLLVPGGGLHDLAEGVARRVGSLLPLESVLRDFPALRAEIVQVGQPLWRVLDRLDSAYEIEFEWCAGPTVSAVKDATLSRLQDLSDDFGLFAIDRVGELGLSDLENESPPWLMDWLEFCGLVTVDGFVLTRPNSLQDRGAAALAMVGQPLTLEEFPGFVTEGRSLRSLANALGFDPRFHRVDRNRWALAEWGFAEYRGIADSIAQELDENGGSIPLDVLTHRLVQRLSVAETSVRAYASAPPFVVEQGVVKRGSRGRDSASGKSWKKTRRVYRRSDGMAMRITVTSDHMRGSGSPCPVGLARELGLSHGETVQYFADAGSVGVYWTGVQPTLGSISPLLQKTDAEVGDTLVVLFQPNRRVDAWVADLNGLNASERLLRLLGDNSAENDVGSLSSALAVAIGMPPESGSADLVAALESRGDHDVAELFLSLRETQAERAAEPPTSVDVEDILDLLR